MRQRSTPTGSRSADDRFSASERASLGVAADVAVSRGDVLVRALAAAGAVGLGGVLVGSLAGSAASAPSPRQDVRILNYLLLLEYLQESFYEEAQAADALDGELRRFAETVGEHEQKHVGSLRALLGSDARPRPEFRFGDAVRSEGRFTAAALTLEETAAAAYIGQAANLTEKRITTIARIVPVEARHAAWIRAVANRSPAPHAADPARTPKQVEKTLERTGFVKQR